MAPCFYGAPCPNKKLLIHDEYDTLRLIPESTKHVVSLCLSVCQMWASRLPVHIVLNQYVRQTVVKTKHSDGVVMPLKEIGLSFKGPISFRYVQWIASVCNEYMEQPDWLAVRGEKQITLKETSVENYSLHNSQSAKCFFLNHGVSCSASVHFTVSLNEIIPVEVKEVLWE